MDHIEKKILIHLFLKDKDYRRDQFRIPLLKLKEISIIIKEPENDTEQALERLVSVGQIVHCSEKYYSGYFISDKGKRKAKTEILSLLELENPKD